MGAKTYEFCHSIECNLVYCRAARLIFTAVNTVAFVYEHGKIA
jgi:hypothetical protein